MRSPLVAMLWENWRLTRVELALRLALGIIASSMALVGLAASTTVAFWILVTLHSCTLFSILKLNGGRFMDGYRPGFPFYLLYARPVPTSFFVAIAMAYDAFSCVALYVVSAVFLGLALGLTLPIFPVTLWLVAFHLCYSCVQWSTSNRVVQYVGSVALLVPLFILLKNRVASPLQVEFSLADIALMVLMCVVAFVLTVAGVMRQRRGGAVATLPRITVAGGYPNWLITLFKFPCPTSSATWAQVWFELKSSGLPVLAIGLALAILTPLVFAIGIPIEIVRPVAAGFAVFSVPIVLNLGGNAFGIRKRQGRTYASTFEATQPYATARLAGLKVLVRSTCVLIALIAVAASVWTSISLVSAWGRWGVIDGILVDGAPGLTLPRDAIGQAIEALTGSGQVALAFAAAIAIALMVAALAVFNALRARYSRRVIVAASVLLFYGFALVVLTWAFRRGIGSEFLGTILAVTRWIATAAMVTAIVYLFWKTFAERVLTVGYACGALAISLVFGAAWVILLQGAGVQLAGMPASSAVSMLWPLLLPLMFSVLAPWSLSRLRHS
jgi:hypothetical protein